MENSIEKSAAHAERACFSRISGQLRCESVAEWSVAANAQYEQPIAFGVVQPKGNVSRTDLRTPDENTQVGHSEPRGPGCRRPAAAAPARRCLQHACLCAAPPRAACAAPASWIASRHTQRSILGFRSLSAALTLTLTLSHTSCATPVSTRRLHVPPERRICPVDSLIQTQRSIPLPRPPSSLSLRHASPCDVSMPPHTPRPRHALRALRALLNQW